MPAPLSAEVALTRAQSRGWIPSVPFPGAEHRWPGHCKTCGEYGEPFFRNFCSPNSKQGPCRPCSGAQKKTETQARAVMALRGLTPLVPYQANGQPWKSECGNCGGVTAPTLSSVIKAIGQEQPKCCDVCRRNGPINASAAEDLLRRAGAEPLEPYPGIKVRWHARCLNNKCKQEIHALLDSIKHAGTGACEACGAYGIKADDDALVYLMTHPVHGAAKIGIAKLGGKRLTQHLLCGWEMDSRVDLLGRQARAVERFVLDRWKALRLPYGVHPDDMPQAGYTETVKMAVRSLVEIRDDLARALREEC